LSTTPNRTTPCGQTTAVSAPYFRVAEGKHCAADEPGLSKSLPELQFPYHLGTWLQISRAAFAAITIREMILRGMI
jgi:hypothetical protein